MKQIRNILVLVTICVLLCACTNYEYGTQHIKLKNMSDADIICQMLWSGSITNADTVLQCSLSTNFIVHKDSSTLIECGYRSWETDFELIPYIQFLIMDKELFNQYNLDASCDTIRKYVPVLQLYQLKLEDLQRLNWTITYPPTAAMRDVKMFPPYGTN